MNIAQTIVKQGALIESLSEQVAEEAKTTAKLIKALKLVNDRLNKLEAKVNKEEW